MPHKVSKVHLKSQLVLKILPGEPSTLPFSFLCSRNLKGKNANAISSSFDETNLVKQKLQLSICLNIT